MKKVRINNEMYEIPDDFDWESYVSRHEDLRASGIVSESSAIWHYCNYGIKENRDYKKNKLLINSKKEESCDLQDVRKKYAISISTLLYYPGEKSKNFLNHMPRIMIDQLTKINFKEINFIIRNNTKSYKNKEILEIINKIKNKYKDRDKINILYEESHNLGFGKGHNANYLLKKCDFFVCLNDDIGMPNAEWFNEAIKKFENDKKIGIIGSSQSPQYVDKIFAFGKNKNINCQKEPDYSEGSILLCRSEVFEKLGGFDDIFDYFYFEDVDLCLRAKQIGYEIENININHQHFRSDSTKKLPQQVKSSYLEHNRAKFLCRWGKYLSKEIKKLNNKILIKIKSDGIGDIVDCYYPVRELIKKHKNNKIEIILSNNKIKNLYEDLGVSIVEDSQDSEYDTIYDLGKLNYSPPFNTLDLIAARLGIDNFDTNPQKPIDFAKKIKTEFNIPQKNYVVMHFDSQRQTFESRMPNLIKLIPTIEFISKKYEIILIGQKIDGHEEYENYISKNKKIKDYRDPATILDIVKFISESKLFVGIDSGPSHIAQLLSIPSFIIYGPINPLTKVYRYENTGCWFNLNFESGAGQYHDFIHPSYHFDIRRDSECVNLDSIELKKEIEKFIKNKFKFDWSVLLDSLRSKQRKYLSLQFHNPLYRNRILCSEISSPSDSDLFIDILNSFEEHALNIVNKNL